MREPSPVYDPQILTQWYRPVEHELAEGLRICLDFLGDRVDTGTRRLAAVLGIIAVDGDQDMARRASLRDLKTLGVLGMELPHLFLADGLGARSDPRHHGIEDQLTTQCPA